ncbi:hypothetical protein BWL13_01636 [Microbacterium oleivorans]|uniref:hypothetical protein n=1 Tax=Microbacterium oleivorans TaxID=273677 RepID=UPI0009787CCD|nr:hypothetical protein [Microbacterium oleivorans]AZS44054.1 hypothetical protein BWL13_01636 [Microbacterium oleivorans]
MNTNTNSWPSSEQFAAAIRDAKRAPEIPAWLRLGPLPVRKIVKIRRRRLIQGGMSRKMADWYAPASVMHDLARVAGMGGVVEFRGDVLVLREEKRPLIDAWVRSEAERELAKMSVDD